MIGGDSTCWDDANAEGFAMEELHYSGPDASLYFGRHTYSAGKDAPGTEVAIKHAKRGASPRLRAEAERQARLSRESGGLIIAPVVASGNFQVEFFFVTPRYRQTLDAWLQGEPDLVARLQVLASLAGNTRLFHALGGRQTVVHGDIKPANVAILEEGPRRHLRFIDLGTTRETSERTRGPRERSYSEGFAPLGQLIPGAPTRGWYDDFAVAVCLYLAVARRMPRSTGAEEALCVDGPHWMLMPDPRTIKVDRYFRLDQVQQKLTADLDYLEGSLRAAALPNGSEVGKRLRALLAAGLQQDPVVRGEKSWLNRCERELSEVVALHAYPVRA